MAVNLSYKQSEFYEPDPSWGIGDCRCMGHRIGDGPMLPAHLYQVRSTQKWNQITVNVSFGYPYPRGVIV